LKVLQSRLNTLPRELKDLFDRLLNRLNNESFKQACVIFRLLRTYYSISDQGPDDTSGAPTLLHLYFADDSYTQSSLQAQFHPIDPVVSKQYSDDMRCRLNARCEGFLEIHGAESHSGYGDRAVGYLHRTAREFIESDHYWSIVMEASGRDSFHPEEYWANALLWVMKSFPWDVDDTATTTLCLRSVALIRARTKFIEKTYLDNLTHGAYKYLHSQKHYPGGLLAYQLAVTRGHHDLGGYVALTLAEADPSLRDAAMSEHIKGPLSASPELQPTLSYYRTSRVFRRLRRRPVFPCCK
jgi:hypothetical protein